MVFVLADALDFESEVHTRRRTIDLKSIRLA